MKTSAEVLSGIFRRTGDGNLEDFSEGAREEVLPNGLLEQFSKEMFEFPIEFLVKLPKELPEKFTWRRIPEGIPEKNSLKKSRRNF